MPASTSTRAPLCPERTTDQGLIGQPPTRGPVLKLELLGPAEGVAQIVEPAMTQRAIVDIPDNDRPVGPRSNHGVAGGFRPPHAPHDGRFVVDEWRGGIGQGASAEAKEIPAHSPRH